MNRNEINYHFYLLLLALFLALLYITRWLPGGSYLNVFSVAIFVTCLNQAKNKRQFFLACFIFQATISYSLMDWTPVPLQTLLRKGEVESVLMYIGLTPLTNLYVYLYGFVRFRLGKLKLPVFLLAFLSAIAYCLLDRHFVFLNVSLGTMFFQTPELLSLSKYTGAFSLVFYLFFCGEIFSYFYKKGRYLKAFLPCLLYIIISFALNIFQQNQNTQSKEVSLALGQSSFSPEQVFKIYEQKADSRDYINFEFLQKRYSQLQENDLLILPESFFPQYFLNPDVLVVEDLKREILDIIKEKKITLVAGAIDGNDKDRYNTVFIKNSENEYSYIKNELMPFGEAIPGAQTFPFLYNFFYRPYVEKSGSNLISFSSQNLSFVPIICSEIFSESISKKISGEKLDAIIHVGSEGWLKDSRARRIILILNQVRAAELGIPIIKVANTGYSGIINEEGEIVKLLPSNVAILKRLKYRIKPNSKSFYFYNQALIKAIFDSLFLIVLFYFLKSFKAPPQKD